MHNLTIFVFNGSIKIFNSLYNSVIVLFHQKVSLQTDVCVQLSIPWVTKSHMCQCHPKANFLIKTIANQVYRQNAVLRGTVGNFCSIHKEVGERIKCGGWRLESKDGLHSIVPFLPLPSCVIQDKLHPKLLKPGSL